MLGQTDKAGFGRRRAVTERDQTARSDPLSFEQCPDSVAGIVEADRSNADDVEPEFTHVGGDASCPADAFLVVLLAEHHDGRFRADAFGIAVDVAIQNEIADQQNSLVAERLYYLDETGDQLEGLAAAPVDRCCKTR